MTTSKIYELAVARGGVFSRDSSDFSEAHISTFIGCLNYCKHEIDEFSLSMNEFVKSDGCPGANLQVAYTNSPNLKASSCSDDHFDYIIVDIGLCSTIWRLISILAIKDIHLSPLNGTYPVGEPDNKISPNVDFDDHKLGLSGPECQIDNERLSFTARVFKFALSWILHHEFAHIWFGHTRFAPWLSNRGPTLNLSSEDKELVFDKTVYALECNADDSASRGVFMQAVDLEMTDKGPKAKEPATRDGALRLARDLLYVLLAVRISFSAMDLQYLEDGKIFQQKRHPATGARMERFIENSKSFFSGTSMETLFQEAVNHSNLMLNFGMIGGFGFKEYTGIPKQQFGNEIHENMGFTWNFIFPSLYKYMRGKYMMGPVINGEPPLMVSNTGEILTKEEYRALKSSQL